MQLRERIQPLQTRRIDLQASAGGNLVKSEPHSRHRASNRYSLHQVAAALLILSTALVACSTVGTQRGAGLSQVAPITQGQKYVMATHSFNVFIGPSRARDGQGETAPGPLAALAAERGKVGHENLAVQMIGGSTPMQHWKQGDGDDSRNIAKVALNKGGVDVFTMSPNALMPEPGIDLFGDLVIKTNPNARILVQNSWSAWDGNGVTASVGGTERPKFANEDHDKADLATIDGWLASLEVKGGYLERMRAQLEGINRRAGRQMAYIVPSSISAYTLRKEILKGNIPGIAKQSEIFRDGMGHPTTPLANVVTYTWYAAMYRESPIGMTALIDRNDPDSAKRELILQQIAWNAVIAEPMSGVKGKPEKVGSGRL
jgi:hypothetical protein